MCYHISPDGNSGLYLWGGITIKRQQFRGAALLLLTALIWGSSFVAQSKGMEAGVVQAFTFNGVRTLLGALVLLPVILVRSIKMKKKGSGTRYSPRKTVLAGLFCGIALFCASNLQQQAFVYDSKASGKIAFLTAMYMVIVPLLGLFFKKRVSPKVWCSVVLGIPGIYLLCMTEGFTVDLTAVFGLLCAVGFAIHILVIDHYSPVVDGVELSCLQFAISGTLSVVCALIFETPDVHSIVAVGPEILYAGIMSCGVAYTLQIIAQKDVEPTVASLIMCMESVFGVLTGWLINGEQLTLTKTCGCVIMFAAIILTQLPDKKVKKRCPDKQEPTDFQNTEKL